MAADPKDTTVTEESTDTASEAVAEVETVASAATNPAQKLSAEALIKAFESEQMKSDLPDIYVGDTVRVGVRISEGNKERVQPYEGVVISKRNGGMNQTITVRRIFQGIGVERVFMLHSPQVANIKVERRGKVRRAKLFICGNGWARPPAEAALRSLRFRPRSIKLWHFRCRPGVHRLAPLVQLVERRSQNLMSGVRVLHGASDESPCVLSLF